MTRKVFVGATQKEVLEKSKGIKGITDVKFFDKLGVWKLTVINYKV